MTDYTPPTENLPTFNSTVFLGGDEFITQNQADKRYLRYPNAQGTENLQVINVNGLATFNNGIEVSGPLANRLIDMNNGEIHQCALVHSQNNNDITIEGRGNGDVILKTNNVNRVNINETGQITIAGTGANGSSIYNPATNTFGPFPGSTTTFDGNVVAVDTTTNATFYPCFVQDATSRPLCIDTTTTPLTYNPNSGTLTATTFSGALSGTATNANNVLVTSDDTNGNYFIPFVKTSGNGNKALFMDDVSGPLVYNPDTQLLSLGNNTAGTGGRYAVTGPDNEIALQCVGGTGGGANARELLVLPKSNQGNYNPSVLAGDVSLVGTSGAGIGTAVIRLTTQSSTNASIGVSGTLAAMAAGGTGITPTTSITVNGSIGNITMNTGSVTRLTIGATGLMTFQGGMSYDNATNTLTATNFAGTATSANNALVTSDNTSGTYYIPFSKTSGTGNKALFQDDTTGPLTYNPSTATLSYNYWDVANPFIFDDFVSYGTASAPFGWFNAVTTLGAARIIYDVSLDAGQGTKLTSRIGLLSISTGANNNSDNFTITGNRIIRPIQVRSITWGFVDCGTGTLASFTTPSPTNVTKSFGLYNTSTPNADDSDLGGIIWRRSSANSTAQNWQFYVNNVAVTNGTGPDTAVCNHCRTTIEFQLSGGNYQTRGIFVNLNNGNSFTSDWVNVPTNPTTGDSALFLGQHLRNNGDASARVLGLDYCLLQNASRAINRGTDNTITR
jgi:hypothetical protein